MSGPETVRLPYAEAPAAAGGGDPQALPAELLDADVWSDEQLQRAGIPVKDAGLVSVGGGIGSFVTVDYLRIAGVPKSALRVLTPLEYPWQTYEYLTRVSQIPAGERLRSDSASCPDNLWGFPSYALREALAAPGLRAKLAPLWQVLTEPLFADYYTPRAGQVFAAMRREHDRIGYAELCEHGVVRAVRRRAGGGYFSLLTQKRPGAPATRTAFRSHYVHVAVGYPGLKYLPDLQEYRQRTGDHHRVVNAYEPHEHLYAELHSRPCTVVVRGGGIVASRILQRLIDDRDRDHTDVRVVHLFRTFIAGPQGPSVFMRRPGGDGWSYQGFNYPKSAWGGQLKAQMRKLEGGDRADLYKLIGGTNTPRRHNWMVQLRRGRAQGWYRTMSGEVEKVGTTTDGALELRVRRAEETVELKADFVIDCTGLEADIAEHRVLADLLEHGGAQRNPLGRLDVERSFEVRGMRAGAGRAYASGAATLGGYFPGVDTFLGLQISAQEICDDLARQGFCRRIGSVRSVRQWWRWARNASI